MLSSKLPDVGTTIFTTMAKLSAQCGAISLSQGAPDFAAPDYLIERLGHHARAGRNQYPAAAGVAPLREEIANLVQRCYGRTVDADAEIHITNGATEALFVAIQCCIKPGDEALVLDPAYDSYAPAVRLAGGQARRVPLSADNYRVDWNRIEASVTPATRLIIVNNPHNPTAQVFSEADWLSLETLAESHDLLVISDEVYEHIVFDGRQRLSASSRPALAARSFVMSSFGKSCHVTGWKIGYCLAPATLLQEFRRVHQFVSFTIFAPAQYALADMLREQPAHFDELAAFYQHKRDVLCDALAGNSLRLLPCAGTYFILADYSAVSDEPDVEFCQRLTREFGVSAIPLSAFYQQPPEQRVLRLCFAKQEETLQEAGRRLAAL